MIRNLWRHLRGLLWTLAFVWHQQCRVLQSFTMTDQWYCLNEKTSNASVEDYSPSTFSTSHIMSSFAFRDSKNMLSSCPVTTTTCIRMSYARVGSPPHH
jgi:hypothetical protein